MPTKIIIFPTHSLAYIASGIAVYCRAIEDLFKDSLEYKISICPLTQIKKQFRGNAYDEHELKEYLEKERPDIVHINGYTNLILSQVTLIAHKMGVKVVYTPHWHPFKTMRLSALKTLYFNIYIKPYLKYVSTIIAINAEEQSFFAQFGRPIELIPHWIKKFPDKNRIIHKKSNMILFIGRLVHKNKGFEYLYHIPEGKYDIHIVGRGNVKLRSDMTQHYQIPDEELSHLYDEASLLVVPSHYEAFSYVSLEALAHGTPILVSDNVRIADYITDRAYCRVFKYGDHVDFVSKIDSIIGNKVDLGSIQATFSRERAKDSYEKLYRNTLKSN